MKKIIKSLIPPILFNLLRKVKSVNKLKPTNEVEYSGRFNNWQDAQVKCTGYDNDKIFNKVKEASLKVKNGEAVCERDSVLFDTPQYAWASLSCLMYVSAVNKGQLKVLDFGGSLGSSYFTNKQFLKNLEVEWSIIEQPHFVEFGKKEIENNILKFYENIDECCQDRKINVIFISSVLQYLEQPYEWLEKLININAKHILLDRMPFSKDGSSFIQVQTVPAIIYKASYPLHILNEVELVKFMNKYDYDLIEKFSETIYNHTENFYPLGLFFEKRKNA
jgi:putative methyltransferase (TIGR04325 family)